MPELRPRKAPAAKLLPKDKTPNKRKGPLSLSLRFFAHHQANKVSAATNDDASPIATKKVKGDVHPKKTKRSSSIKKPTEEEQPAIEEDENEVSGDDEALALAKIVDSDDDADDADDAGDATPDEEIKA